MVMEPCFCIGIQGGSCCGKTSLAAEISKILGEARCLTISLDMFFRSHDRLADGSDPTTYDWDCPDATDWVAATACVRDLKHWKSATVPRFEYVTGLSEAGAVVSPRPFLIIEGLLPFYNTELRSHFDFRVFIDVPLDLLLIRRLFRDVVGGDRGWTLTQMLQYQSHCTRPAHIRWVEPGKQIADIVLDGERPSSELAGLVLSLVAQRLTPRLHRAQELV